MAGSALLNAQAIIDIAQLAPGMRVADFGAGRSGHLVIPVARAVGEEGAVYAVDIHPEALSMIHGHRSLHGLSQLVATRGDIERFGGVQSIAERSLDRVFVVNTLWMTKRLADIVAEARRLLADDGVIIVVDWDPNTRHAVAPESSLRVAPASIDRLFAEGGCARCGSFQPSRHHWGRIYSS
jgi:ubiquinone/menaquinone biosynthesis C-methylase UbiE